MKRKRTSDHIDDPQTCDLTLTDANGRSVKVHKALLVDKSDYFATVLSHSNLHELQIDESYLIELIYYLYNHETLERDEMYTHFQAHTDFDLDSKDLNPKSLNADIYILIQLLALSRKYSFRHLHRHLLSKINYKLHPLSAIFVYNCAGNLDLVELQQSTRLVILTWLPHLQKTEAFLSLSKEAIYDIFISENPDVDAECKLNALSRWWSHNKNSDITDLWVKLVARSHNQEPV